MIQRLIYKISPERHRKLPRPVKMLLNPWMKKLGDPPTDPPERSSDGVAADPRDRDA